MAMCIHFFIYISIHLYNGWWYIYENTYLYFSALLTIDIDVAVVIAFILPRLLEKIPIDVLMNISKIFLMTSSFIIITVQFLSVKC